MQGYLCFFMSFMFKRVIFFGFWVKYKVYKTSDFIIIFFWINLTLLEVTTTIDIVVAAK